MIVNVALIRLKLRPGEPTGGFEVPLFVPCLGVLINATLVVARLADPAAGILAPLVAAAMVIGISLLYVFVRPKNISEEVLEAVEAES
jgi:hypothetical protein